MTDRGRTRALDPIAVVETAYQLESSEEDWLRALSDAAQLDTGLGTSAHVHDEKVPPNPDGLKRWGTPAGYAEGQQQLMASMPPDLIVRMHREAPSVTSVTELMGTSFGGPVNALGIGDALMVFAYDGMGRCAVFNGLREGALRPTAYERRLWARLTVHIAAGLRLRGLLQRPTLESDDVEAVLEPDGRCLDARGQASRQSARDVLRDTARRIDRARAHAGRQAPEEALELWQGLTAGRWSLVDHIDSDGRRFVIARRNDPQPADPRALSLRERQVATFAAVGRPNKLIAYALGISPAAVSTHLRQALRKLGLSSTAELRANYFSLREPDATS
jgi:DNA-binding CsgD family transcriptional regulator